MIDRLPRFSFAAGMALLWLGVVIGISVDPMLATVAALSFKFALGVPAFTIGIGEILGMATVAALVFVIWRGRINQWVEK